MSEAGSEGDIISEGGVQLVRLDDADGCEHWLDPITREVITILPGQNPFESREEATNPSAESILASNIAKIKREAERRIVSSFPLETQANMTARRMELLEIRLDRVLTAPEQTELDGIKDARTYIDAVRAFSDSLEADPPEDIPGADWPTI